MTNYGALIILQTIHQQYHDTINFSQVKQIYVFGYLLMQRICFIYYM